MARKRATGKAGSVNLDSVAVPITQWTANLDANLQENTDTGDYDAVSGQTWESYVPGKRSGTIDIEGNVDLTATTGTADMVVAKMLADDPLPIELKFDQSTYFGFGTVILENVKVTSPVSDNITFTSTARLVGPLTLGAPTP